MVISITSMVATRIQAVLPESRTAATSSTTASAGAGVAASIAAGATLRESWAMTVAGPANKRKAKI